MTETLAGQFVRYLTFQYYIVPNVTFRSAVFSTDCFLTKLKLRVAVQAPCTFNRRKCVNIFCDIVLHRHRKHVFKLRRARSDRSGVADDAGIVGTRSVSLKTSLKINFTL